MNRTYKQIALFALLVGLDQVTKWWVEQQTPFFHMTIIDGFFDIVKAHNFGVAFSLFANGNHQGRTSLLLGITIGIAIAVGLWWWRERRNQGLLSWLLTLILAGAIGNIWDRIQLGYVVDFIDLHIVIDNHDYHWPAFNIADSCISISVVLLLITSFRYKP